MTEQGRRQNRRERNAAREQHKKHPERHSGKHSGKDLTTKRQKKKNEKTPSIKWFLLTAGILLLLIAGILLWRTLAGRAVEAVKPVEEEAVIVLPEETEEPETELTQTQKDASEGVIGETSEEVQQDPQSNGNDRQDGNTVNITAGQGQAAGETGTLTYGIDVAKYQGIIDWPQVKSAGMDFAIIRAGYRTSGTGVLCEDAQAKYNLQEAQAAGLKIGVYFFSTALNEAEAIEEAIWLTEFIARYKITYPVVYNCENFKSQESRQYLLSKEQRTQNAVAFLERVRAAGYTPMFYANKSEMENSQDWDMTKLSKYKIWTAYYPDPTYPQLASSGYPGEAMWQYTNRGNVPGVDYDVDLNVAYFGYEQEAQPKDDTPVEAVSANVEAHITFQEVNETITAKTRTNVRSVPNSDSPDTVIAQIINGDLVTRTGIGSNGWSRLIYNGQTCYAMSAYLTTELPEHSGGNETSTQGSGQSGGSSGTAENSVYRSVNEQVTAKENTNLRSEADRTTPENIVGMLRYGEVLTRTGIGSNGWSRLTYNGQTVYAVSGYLTTDLSYQDKSRPTPENPDGNAVFTMVNEQVTAKSVTNLRSLPSTESEDTIVTAIRKGEVVTRIGIGSNGWSKISYNGQTLYAISSYLTAAES